MPQGLTCAPCCHFAQGKHLNSRSGIFPRLHGSVEEVKAKLAPVHTSLAVSLRKLDVQGKGFLPVEGVHSSLKETGVFLSQADVDTFLQVLVTYVLMWHHTPKMYITSPHPHLCPAPDSDLAVFA